MLYLFTDGGLSYGPRPPQYGDRPRPPGPEKGRNAMKTTTTTAPAHVTRLPYAGPDVMNADPGAHAPRRPRDPMNDDGRTAADFPALDVSEAAALVGACVYRAAELVADRTGTTAAAILDGIRGDAELETWARCLERAADPDAAAAGLVLFVYRAASSAVKALHYAETGRRGRLTAAEARQHYDGDTGRAVVVTDYHAAGITEGPEPAAIRAEIIPRCLKYVSAEKREHAAAVVAAVAAGYSVTEAARALHIPERAAYDLLNAVKAARAIIDAEDGDAAALARREMSDARALAQLDKRRRAAAVAAVAATVAAPDAKEAAAAAAAGPRFSPAYAARIDAAAARAADMKRHAARPRTLAAGRAPAPIPAAVIPLDVIARDIRAK